MVRFDTSVLDAALKNRRARDEKTRLETLDRARACLIEIRAKYAIKKACLTGSLLLPGQWMEHSDVDVAVTGAGRFILDIMKDLEEATGRDADVIDLDGHPHTEIIAKRGKVVYG